jgi:PAT family acetyl-CoA transporter-like MFS transporter 1
MGGTYMTILNTVSNLGAKWMESVTLFTIDRVNTNVCVAKGTREIIGSCATDALKAACKGKCATTDTPYYIVVMLSPVIAYAWLRLTRKTIDWLSQAQKSHWRVKQA